MTYQASQIAGMQLDILGIGESLSSLSQAFTTVNGEITNLKTADTALQGSIGSLQTTVGGLDTKIQGNTVAIEGLRTDFQNKDFFRGMVLSISQMLDIPEPTQNDYCYVMDNDKHIWCYDLGNWEDTGQEVPSQVVPAGDSTPLPNATVGSAGVSDSYSRSDHVHPGLTSGVTLDTEQTITGAKTFSTPIKVPDATDPAHAITKKTFDQIVGNLQTILDDILG